MYSTLHNQSLTTSVNSNLAAYKPLEFWNGTDKNSLIYSVSHSSTHSLNMYYHLLCIRLNNSKNRCGFCYPRTQSLQREILESNNYTNKCSITNFHRKYEGNVQDAVRLYEHLKRYLSSLMAGPRELWPLSWDYKTRVASHF